MKRLLIVLLSSCIAFSSVQGYTPDKNKKKKNKAEYKKWKKKAKAFVKNPMALKAKEEGYQRQIEELTQKNNELQEQYNQLQEQYDQLNAELRSKSNQLEICQQEKERLKTAYEAQKQLMKKDAMPGLVYRVQIGAFRYFDLSKYLKHTENFYGETQDGLNKYTIGKFRDYEMAEAFKKDLRRMGIRDAWVVPYIDGVRVTMQEARRYEQMQRQQGNANP